MSETGVAGAGARAMRFMALALLLVLSACVTAPSDSRIKESEFAALEARFTQHIDVLASEEFGGRRPGTIGETKTLDYLRREFESAGFVSGTNDPAHPWNAPAVLASVTGGESRIEFQIGRRKVELEAGEAAAFTNRRRGLIEQGELAFVGFGGGNVGQDIVRGRVAVFLAGEPQAAAETRRTLLERGAVAVMAVLSDGSRIERMRAQRSRERLELAVDVDDQLSLFVTEVGMARALGAKAWEELRAAANAESGFSAVKLNARITVEATAQRREVPSHNFIARLPGTSPDAGAILLLAHWDHFGTCGPEDAADRLCNGAVDNASGLALMIELGKRLAKGPPLGRDIYVLGTTAEEWGLLGARAFAEEPPIPLESIVAAFNFDTVAIGPRGSAVGFIGEGRTALDEVIRQAVADAGRELVPRERAEPFLQRQDGWALLQRNVPAVVVSNAFGDEERFRAFMSSTYHQASDEPGKLELGGAVDDLFLHEMLIRRLADPKQYP